MTIAATAQAAAQDLLAALPDGEANLENGRTVYTTVCAPCHGESGRGGEGGGAPLVNRLDLAAIVRILNDGRNQMPALGAALSQEQVRDVSHYVLEELLP